MAIERVLVDGDSTAVDAAIIQDTVSNHIVVDYSSYFSRIADSLETMASNSTAILEKLTTIAEKQTAMESYQKKIKELAEGEGVHMLSPLEYVGFVTTYRRLIEEGTILKWRDVEVSEKEVSKALNDLGKYLDKIQRNIPRAF